MLINDFPLIMLRCLICTVLIEGVAAFVLGIRKPADQAVVALANVLTNPPLVVSTTLIGLFCARGAYIFTMALAEVAAVLIEAFVYRSVMKLGAGSGDGRFAFFVGGDVRAATKYAPVIVSIVLNSCSYSLGELLNKIVF